MSTGLADATTQAVRPMNSPNHGPATPSRSFSAASIAGTEQSLPKRMMDLIAELRPYNFVGTEVTFPDLSQWRLTEALSDIELQQDHSPCEARQVFVAHCVSDPSNIHEDLTEAVIKMKFQVRASSETETDYEERLSECIANFGHTPKDQEMTYREIKRVKTALDYCLAPATEPNTDTYNEIFALHRFADYECRSAPWLLSFSETTIQQAIHRRSILGGYLIYILMPKLPGKPLTQKFFRGCSSHERDQIRKAFQTALVDVWQCGICPNDRSLSNILWNEELKECYIVDYEDCLVPSVEKQKSLTFTNDQFNLWKLEEDRYKDSI